MKVQKGERRGDVVVLRATATAGEVESAFNRAEETFSEQMNLKPEDGKTIAEAAFEQLSIANLETVVAPQVLEALVPFAVQQTSIMPAFPPRPIAASTPMRGKAFSFDIELTPKRNYELSSYEPVEFTIEPYREDSEEVERQLERMVAGSAQYRALNPRPVEKDDICLLRVEATINGSISRGLTTEGRPYHMGKGNLPEEFDRNILGMEVGQSKSFEFSGPSIDEKGEPTVDTVSCTVTVLEIQELVQEELSDEWVARYLPMYKDLADLRSSVSRAVNHRNLVEYENYKRTLAAAELSKRFVGTIPDEVYEATYDSSLRKLKSQLSARGIAFDDYVLQQGGKQQFKMLFMVQVRQTIMQGYALDALYRHLGLKYSNEDIRGVCESVNPQNPFSVKERMERSGNGYALEEAAQRFCASNWLVDHSTVIQRDK